MLPLAIAAAVLAEHRRTTMPAWALDALVDGSSPAALALWERIYAQQCDEKGALTPSSDEHGAERKEAWATLRSSDSCPVNALRNLDHLCLQDGCLVTREEGRGGA